MNPVQKKKRDGLLATQVISSSKAKKHAARPTQQTKRVNISHLLIPRTKQ